MSTITFDFRHHYVRGERRESEQIAYQWDLGHVMNVFVPEDATYTIGYCFGDYEKTEDYAIDTKVQEQDGSYKLTAHIPNKYFERSRELRVYVVGSADDHIITTYEGFITIRGRLMPDDYVDDDPENGATQIIEVAREYATKSESFAVGGTGTRLGEDTDNAKYYLEQAEAVAESIPEDYSELSDDVDQLKNAIDESINFSYSNCLALLKAPSGTSHQVTCVKNSDESYTFTGTSDSATVFAFTKQTDPVPSWMKVGDTFDVIYSSTNISFLIRFYDSNGTLISGMSVKNNFTVTVPTGTYGVVIRFGIDSSGLVCDETVHPTLLKRNNYTQTLIDNVNNKFGGMELPAILSEIGKLSLVNYLCFCNSPEGTAHHITCSKNQDGSYTFTGNSDADVTFIFVRPDADLPSWVEKGKTYRILYSSTNVTFSFWFYDSEMNKLSESKSGKSDYYVTVPTNTAHVRIVFSVVNGVTCNETVHPFVIDKNSYIMSLINSDSFLPFYYDTYLSEKEEEIINKKALIGRGGMTFAFITDQHWSENTKFSSGLLKKITNACSFSLIVSGGDTITEGITKAKGYRLLCDYINSLKSCDIYNHLIPTIGNHEWNNPRNNNNTFELMEKEEQFSVMDDKTFSYYIDFPKTKLRMFVISCDYDSSVPPDARKWFASQLLEIPTGYNVILISHVGLVENSGTISKHSGYGFLHAILTAWKNRTSITLWNVPYNYSEAKGKFLFAITGHSHKDAYMYENGILTIGTTCDSYSGELGGLTRTPGTVLEQAFDIVNSKVDDTNGNAVYLTRIGAGVNRAFNYTPTEIANGNTKTVVSKLTGSLTWGTSDSSVATISNGVISAVNAGTAVITATDANGNFETWLVIVSES